jgi:hypothetical protein
MRSVRSFRDDWREWPDDIRDEFLARLTADELAELLSRFGITCHDHQLPPLLGNNGEPWTIWLLIGGRGAGKTRAGAEWVKSIANAPKQDGEGERRIALIGETEHEIREVMIEGVSGLLSVHPRGRSGRRRGGALNSITARSRRPFRRKIRKACAVRNFPPPGRTSSPSGVMPKQPSICCSSDCALARGRGR